MYQLTATLQTRDEKGHPIIYLKGTKFMKNVPKDIIDEYKSGSNIVKKLSAPEPKKKEAPPESKVPVAGKSKTNTRKKL